MPTPAAHFGYSSFSLGFERMTDKTILTVRMNGPFCLLGKDGTDHTPRNRKAQALIALLATSPALRRSRPWLQDKLWSQSSSERGNASLRQTLTAIRKSLHEHGEILVASRLDVSLNPDLVKVDWDKSPEGMERGFLEGIDVADPEFEDWLRTMRRSGRVRPEIVVAPLSDKPRWKVAVGCEPNSQTSAATLGCIDMIEQILREQGELELTENPKDETADRLVHVTLRAVPGPQGTAALRLMATDPQLNRQIWAETWMVPANFQPGGQDVNLMAMVFRLQSELTRYMAQVHNLIGTNACPPLVLGAAIPRIFSFQPTELDRAAQMLSENMDSHNAAQFLGWQAQIAVINLIEQFTDAPEACIESGKMLAAKAIEADPMNSVVLSTAANARVLLDRGDASSGGDLAQLAVRVNPANPFAWWAYSNVSIYAQQHDDALKSARIASRLAALTPLQFWCDFQLGLAALTVGDLDTAKRALETSASLAPQFRPPRRYLLAIYAHRREIEKAARMVVQLKKLEPSFSLDGFVNDPKYPVSVVRKENMLTWSSFQDLTSAV